jgi:hypothetical protein
MLDHPEAYANYPSAGNVKLHAQMGPGLENTASYSHANNEIKAYGDTPENIRNSLLHELDHHIQSVEGFSRGTNDEHIYDTLQKVRQIYDTPKIPDDKRFAAEYYWNRWGEKSSRVVEDRSRLTPEQRAAVSPREQMSPGGYTGDDTAWGILARAKKDTTKNFDPATKQKIIDKLRQVYK